MNLLEIKNITIAYGKRIIIENCSLSLPEGKIFAVLGASGDGKTTLLKSIAGLLPIQNGEIFFKNERVKDSKQELIPGHEQIKLINQDFDLDLFHSVKENIRLKLLAYDETYITEKCNELLDITGLQEYKNMRSNELSGGQKQRLAIARALADNPELILLDEPFNQLDFQMKKRISRHIQKYLSENKISAILVSHNGIEAMEWADQIIYLKKGKVERMDTPDQFYENPASFDEALFFGELNQIVIENEKIYFRPGQFSCNFTKKYPYSLKIKFLLKKNLGWYSEYVFRSEYQEIKLFSNDDLSDLKEVFIHPMKIND